MLAPASGLADAPLCAVTGPSPPGPSTTSPAPPPASPRENSFRSDSFAASREANEQGQIRNIKSVLKVSVGETSSAYSLKSLIYLLKERDQVGLPDTWSAG